MNVILIAVIILGVVGLVASIMLYAASKKFAVVEDERIGQVAEVLPQANCGGCGYPGCAGFAAACVKAADGGSLEGKLCPVGGQPVMEKVAGILGLAATASTPKVAVVRCNGTCANRPRVVDYDGVRSCRVQLLAGTGETACAFGCLGGGDCVAACQFGALCINPETGLPEVDEERCTACGACVKTCPRRVIELRPKGPKNRRMVVMCVNRRPVRSRPSLSTTIWPISTRKSASCAESVRKLARKEPSMPSTSRRVSRKWRNRLQQQPRNQPIRRHNRYPLPQHSL